MSGLYQRTLEIYRQRDSLRLVSKDEAGGAMEEIPPEERENILREIDGILSRHREPVAATRARGGKSGLALPFLVNFIIFAAVAVVLVLFTWSLNGEELQLASGARSLKGAESQIVQALRQESQAQIGQKDQEILVFRKKLEDASAERERLRSQSAAVVQQKAQELAAKMSSSLEAERARLQSSGLNAKGLEDRMRLYEARLKADAARQAAAFQKKADEEAAKNEAAVSALMAEYRRNMDQAQAERGGLRRQYQNSEAELRSQYAKDTQALQGEKSQALADLRRMQDIQRQEGLVSSRLLSSYDDINAQIKAGDYPAALKSLASLRASLDSESARELPAIQKRRPVELFIIGSLEELIRSRIEREQGDAAALVETKRRIAALREKAALGEGSFLAKDYQASRRYYLSALDEIPEARGGYSRLELMAGLERGAKAEASRRSWQVLVAQGSTRVREGQWQAALDRYTQALALLLDDQAAANSFVDQVAQAGYSIGAAKDNSQRALLPDRIALMRKELQVEPAAAEAFSPEFSSLIQAKLLLWQIIGTDPVKSKYPALYDTMQKYFDTFASQQLQAGRAAALGDLVALTESLKKGKKLAKAVPASDRDSMLRLLDALEALVRQ